MDEAIANGRALLASHPEMALKQAHAILNHDRGHGNALRLAAAAHRALGQGQMAQRAEMAAIKASEKAPDLVAAVRAIDRGDFSEASRLAAHHLRNAPDDLAALTVSAEAATALGLPDKGESLLREVLERAPGFATARFLLLNALILQDEFAQAKAILQDIISHAPGDLVALRLLSRIETYLGNHSGAAAAIETLMQAKPPVAEDWVVYGDALRFSSRKKDAIAAYRSALQINPHFGRAWWSLADIDAGAITDDDITQMQSAAKMVANDPEHLGNLHFALGIVHDKRQQAEQAFAQFAAGNALRIKAQPYDADEISGQVDRYLATLSSQAIPELTNNPGQQPIPIFIVGMPRSGSTLVERILGQHSQIEALGELSIAPHIVERLRVDQGPGGLEQYIASLSQGDLATLGERYIARARQQRKTDKPYFVDKLHMNWRHLALIMRMLPQARIIDVRRGALDCCWSNYKTLFARGHPAASNQSDLGRFYCDYVRFTDQLRAMAPGRIHLLDYEALVDDIAAVTARMFDAIGLPPQSQCLEFHKSTDPVATASSEQVRKPLNRNGLNVWKPYEPWLDDLKQALGPHAAS